MADNKSAEQRARDMLERMGVDGAQSMTAGDVVELANLIGGIAAEREACAKVCEDLLAFDMDDPGQSCANAIRKRGKKQLT
jgi:hypothetical protein